MSNTRRQLFAFPKTVSLPSGYTKLEEGLHLNGSQYVYVGYIPFKDASGLYLDFSLPNFTSYLGTVDIIYGSHSPWTLELIHNSSDYNKGTFEFSNGYVTIDAGSLAQRRQLLCGVPFIKFGDSYSYGTGSQGSESFIIGGDLSYDRECIECTIFRCVLFSTSEEPRYDLHPCYSSSHGTNGLYCTINNQFYPVSNL